MIRNRILITGANGFVGQHLCAHLVAIGRKVTASVRPKATRLRVPGSDSLRILVVPDITAYEHWPEQLADVDTVIHLAARVHVMQDRSSDPLAEFRKVNVACYERAC